MAKASTKVIDPTEPKRLYERLKTERGTALDRARKNSSLTLPGFVPDDGQDAGASFEQPYQSLGARGVNNLASWLLVTLLPPDQSFGKLAVPAEMEVELGERVVEVRAEFNRITARAQTLVETSAARPVWGEVFRHLLIAGNALAHVPVDGTTPRLFRLDQYVLVRDEKGRPLQGIVEEEVLPSALDEETRNSVGLTVDANAAQEKRVKLYTHIYREGDDLKHYQAINDKLVEGSEGASPANAPAWFFLRWAAVPGSDYGRALVSEYLGDLLTMEDISKAIVEFATAAARIINIVDPNAGIDVEALAQAETGSYITGYGDRINTLQLEKTQDFQVVNTVLERIEQRLAQAFMLRSGMTRDAERVTAEEIRAVAQELENVLGGVYTVLSAEFQLPYMRRLLYVLAKLGDAPKLPETVQPVIITGFAALGRNHSSQRLRDALADVQMFLGPEGIARLDQDAIIARILDGRGVEDADRLVKSPDQQAQEQQQNMAAQAGLAAAPNIAKGAMDAAIQQQQGQA